MARNIILVWYSYQRTKVHYISDQSLVYYRTLQEYFSVSDLGSVSDTTGYRQTQKAQNVWAGEAGQIAPTSLGIKPLQQVQAVAIHIPGRHSSRLHCIACIALFLSAILCARSTADLEFAPHALFFVVPSAVYKQYIDYRCAGFTGYSITPQRKQQQNSSSSIAVAAAAIAVVAVVAAAAVVQAASRSFVCSY